MANTYKSSVYLKNGRVRPSGQNNAEAITATVTIPAGTTLGVGDVLKFAILGENVRIKSFNLNCDAFDSNAAATLAGSLGITASSDVTQEQPDYTACLLATTAKLSGNSSAKVNLARVDGEATANDSFAVTPFPVQTTTQEVILTIATAAATAITDDDRSITLEFTYQYAYPDVSLTGVSNSTYPFAGAKVYSPATVDTYNGIAP